MSEIKSLSVGDGDFFYIRHESANFTIIDCNLTEEKADEVNGELRRKARGDVIKRFISTHPDEDHFHGIELLDDDFVRPNFYCVDNAVEKDDETPSFLTYKELRGGETAYHLYKGMSRKWFNVGDEKRGRSGLSVLWPDTSSENFKDALRRANGGESPNDISPVIRYSLENGVTAVWCGDLETGFMEAIEDEIELTRADVVFAPHHGRKSGRLPSSWLERLDPKLVVIGEAPSDLLNYYSGWNTITQNSAGDILLACSAGKADVYVASEGYRVDFLRRDHDAAPTYDGLRYLGTLDCG